MLGNQLKDVSLIHMKANIQSNEYHFNPQFVRLSMSTVVSGRVWARGTADEVKVRALQSWDLHLK